MGKQKWHQERDLSFHLKGAHHSPPALYLLHAAFVSSDIKQTWRSETQNIPFCNSRQKKGPLLLFGQFDTKLCNTRFNLERALTKHIYDTLCRFPVFKMSTISSIQIHFFSCDMIKESRSQKRVQTLLWRP